MVSLIGLVWLPRLKIHNVRVEDFFKVKKEHFRVGFLCQIDWYGCRCKRTFIGTTRRSERQDLLQCTQKKELETKYFLSTIMTPVKLRRLNVGNE